MTDVLAKYRLVLVTALLGGAAFVRAVKPEWVVPEDADLKTWADALLGSGSAVAWLTTYYFTSTTSGTLAETK